MARKKPTKSQKIREYLQTDREAGPKKVVEELKKKGVTVSLPLVSAVKGRLAASNGKPRRGRKRRGLQSKSGRRPNSETVAISGLIEARSFANKVGGVEKAAMLLQTLAKITG